MIEDLFHGVRVALLVEVGVAAIILICWMTLCLLMYGCA